MDTKAIGADRKRQEKICDMLVRLYDGWQKRKRSEAKVQKRKAEKLREISKRKLKRIRKAERCDKHGPVKIIYKDGVKL